MAHNSNFTKIWDPPGIVNGMSIYEVSMAVHAIQDIGACCMSSSINKWAKFKPVRYPGIVTLPTTHANANYGFDFSQSGAGCRLNGSQINELLTRAKNNAGEWTYVRPTGMLSSGPYRLGDFSAVNTGSATDGYNVEAQQPMYASSREYSSRYNLQAYLIKTQGNNVELDLKDFGIITEGGSDYTNWYVAPLYRIYGGNASLVAPESWIPLADLFGTLDYEAVTIASYVAQDVKTTYECCWVAFQSEDGEVPDDNMMFYLPGGYCTVVYNPIAGVLTVSNGDAYYQHSIYSRPTRYTDMFGKTVGLNFSYHNYVTGNVSSLVISLEFGFSEDESGEESIEIIDTRTLAVPSIAPDEGDNTAELYMTFPYTGYPGNYYLRASYTYTDSRGTHTRYINLVNKQSVTTEQNWVDLNTIFGI